MNIKDKRITILGLGKSGYGAAKLANQLGARVFVSDLGNKKITLSNANKLLIKHNIAFETGLHSNKIYDTDLIVVSPGISKNSKVIKNAIELNIKVISEIEFAFYFTNNPIIAITEFGFVRFAWRISFLASLLAFSVTEQVLIT